MSISNFFIINSANIEYLPWTGHCSKYSGCIKKERRPKKSLGEKERNEIQIFYFEVSKSGFGCKLENIFEGFYAPPDTFRMPGYAWGRGDFIK